MKAGGQKCVNKDSLYPKLQRLCHKTWLLSPRHQIFNNDLIIVIGGAQPWFSPIPLYHHIYNMTCYKYSPCTGPTALALKADTMSSKAYIMQLAFVESIEKTVTVVDSKYHGLRTPNEGINQINLKIWANVADKKCSHQPYLKVREWE